VGKHVRALRDAGYSIESAAGSGYRFVSAPDAPVPAEVSRLLRTDFWVRLEGGGVTDSTNDDARRLAEAGAAEGTAVLASAQRRGRGRLGRSWTSPEGGVYLSAVLRPALRPADLGPLPLVIALGVARAIKALGASPQLKWPNDVLIDGRKVAGILLELSAEADAVRWVVAGVGVNVDALEGDAAPSATSLREAGAQAGRAQVAASVLDGIAEAYREYLGGGFGPLADEWRARDALAGREVEVRDLAGDLIASGRVTGIGPDGRLLLETRDGPVSVPTGDVTLRR
jgi:BirA family biotin operon repressor/biotin-[acetyl-CoA-carboxylase] ligase